MARDALHRPTHIEACYGRLVMLTLHPAAVVLESLGAGGDPPTCLCVIVGHDPFGLWVQPAEGPLADRKLAGKDWHLMMPWGHILSIAVSADTSPPPTDPSWRGLISAGTRARQSRQSGTAAEPSRHVGTADEQ